MDTSSSSVLLPQWLRALLTEKFFESCTIHEDSKKNKKNVFCLDCCEGFCSHCLSPHASHRLLQIRRYVCHDVLRLDDAFKLMNCNLVQSYKSNGEKVVFLNPRPQTKTGRASNDICSICFERELQKGYLFCCLSCKLQHILRDGNNVSKHVYEFESITLPKPSSLDDNGQMTSPDTYFGSRVSCETSGAGGVDCNQNSCFSFRKRSRKSVPHRAPFF